MTELQKKSTKKKQSKNVASRKKSLALPLKGHSKPEFRGFTKKGKGHVLILRDKLGLTRNQYARALSITERRLATIEKEEKLSHSANRSQEQFVRLVSALSDVMKKESIGEWINTPNQSFSGKKPIEVIEHGEIDRIWQMIFELSSGVVY